MRKIIALIGIICLLIIIECKKDTSYTPSCTGATKSFKTDVQPIFQSYCTQCHNFSRYSQISGSSSAIRSKIVDGSMPQNATLSTDQKNNIVCWIDNGAKNN